jgi:hypothetical protein
MPDAVVVDEIVRDCLFTSEEAEGQTQEEFLLTHEHVIVRGVLMDFAFNPKRLEENKDKIVEQLLDLPSSFMQSEGGGFSFLEACMDREGNQWTGLHKTMEALFALGQGVGRVTLPLPRGMWDVLPGGMPYFVVIDQEPEPEEEAA